jgi:hypothetical protein
LAIARVHVHRLDELFLMNLVELEDRVSVEATRIDERERSLLQLRRAARELVGRHRFHGLRFLRWRRLRDSFGRLRREVHLVVRGLHCRLDVTQDRDVLGLEDAWSLEPHRQLAVAALQPEALGQRREVERLEGIRCSEPAPAFELWPLEDRDEPQNVARKNGHQEQRRVAIASEDVERRVLRHVAIDLQDVAGTVRRITASRLQLRVCRLANQRDDGAHRVTITSVPIAPRA